MKRKVLVFLLIMALILGLIPVTAVSSYATDDNENCLEEQISDALETAFFRILGADSTVSLFENATEIESFSRLTGEKEYETLLNIGDSTSFGYGLSTLSPNVADFSKTFGWGKCDPEAWPYLLAEELGIDFEKHTDGETETPWYLDLTEEGNHFASIAMGFLRTMEFKWLLGDDEARDSFGKRVFKTESGGKSYLKYMHIRDEGGNAVACVPGGTPNISEVRSLLAKNIENADLITVTIGGNDILNYPIMAVLYENTVEDENWEYLSEHSEGVQILKETLLPLIAEYLSEGVEPEELETVLSYAEHTVYGYLCFTTLFGEVMDQIHEMNPEADVILMGLYNPYQSLYYQSEDTADVKLAIGKLFELLLPFVNGVYRNYAQNHASWCCYVNTVGAEVISETEDYAYINDEERNLATNPDVFIQLHITDDYNLGSHESAAGHRYIFEEMLKALKKDETSQAERTERKEKEEQAEKDWQDQTEKHRQILECLSKFIKKETLDFAEEVKRAVSNQTAFVKEAAENLAEPEETVSDKKTLVLEMTEMLKTQTEKTVNAIQNTREEIQNQVVLYAGNAAESLFEYNQNILSFWNGFWKGYSK